MIPRLAALLVLDLALVIGATLRLCPVPVAMAGHALVGACALTGWLRAGERLGVAPAIAGMFGPLGMLLALWCHRRDTDGADRGGMVQATEDEGPAPPRPGPRAALRMLDGRVHHASPERLGSLVTVLRHGSVHDRRRALESVVRAFRPTLSPLLAIALTDRDQTIRALAAAAVARVGQNLTAARAEAATRRDGAEAVDSDRTLVALLLDHARGNVLLSDSQRDHLRDDALAVLEKAGQDGEPLWRRTRIEASWAAGDYAEVDALTAGATPAEAAGAGAAVDWWRRARA